MYYVIGENERDEYDVWVELTASQALAIRNEYIMLNKNVKSGKMPNLKVDLYEEVS
jgi:hypothetical protein